MTDKKKRPESKTKEVSYTYWVSKPTGEAKAAFVPQKIDSQEAEKIASLCREKSQGSSWNTAGTWEEKSIPCDCMKEYLKSCIDKIQDSDKKWKLTDVESISGDVIYGKLTVVYCGNE